MAIHPVGPLPASTYWLRRAALLVGVLVLLLVAKSCVGGDGGGDGGPRDNVAAPKPTATTSPPSPSAEPTSATGECDDAALTLTADTDDEIYALGSKPKITVIVKNTSAQSCTRDLGSGAVELLVFSGSDRVWSSDDCTKSAAKDLVALPAGGQKTVSVVIWSGKRSKPGCPGDRAQAKAGTYRLTARLGTKRSDEAIFRFRS